jgi:excisionase family DNA binding protein
MDHMQKLYRVSDAALLLGCTEPTLRHRIARGHLRVLRDEFGSVRIPDASIDEYIARLEARSA